MTASPTSVAPDVTEFVEALAALEAKASAAKDEAEAEGSSTPSGPREAGPITAVAKPGVSSSPRVAETAAEARRAARKYRKLTEAEWLQVKVLWEFGTATLDDLSIRFGPSKESIRSKIRAEGWVRGSRAHEIAEATESSLKGEAAKNVQRISAMKEEYLRYSKAITQLTMRELTKAAGASTPLGTLKDTMITLQKAGQIISNMRDENFHLFGLYDNENAGEEIPDLGITEYSPEEIAQLQRDLGDLEQNLPQADDDDEPAAGMPEFE